MTIYTKLKALDETLNSLYDSSLSTSRGLLLIKQTIGGFGELLEPIEGLSEAIKLMEDQPKPMVYQNTILEAARRFQKMSEGS